MKLENVILGQITTEKAERQKENRTYTLHVSPNANKVQVKKALKKFYDIDATNVRVMRTTPKFRNLGRRSPMEKRHRTKKALVTLAKDSKPLDIAAFQA